jgi:hypothetical protein
MSVSTPSFADGYAGSTKDFFTGVKDCLNNGRKGYEALGVIGSYFQIGDLAFYDKPGGVNVKNPRNRLGVTGVIHAGGGESSYYPIFCGREKGFIKIGDLWVSEKDINDRGYSIIPINKWIEGLGKHNYISSSPARIKTAKGEITVKEGYFSITGDGCGKDGYCPVKYWESYQPLCTDSVIKTPPKYSGKMKVFDSDFIPIFHDSVSDSDSATVCEVKLLEDAVLNLENGEKTLLKKETLALVYCGQDSCVVYESSKDDGLLRDVGEFSPYNKTGDVIIELINPDAGLLGC